jgi:hypothetical protein
MIPKLEDPAVFRDFHLDPELNTVTWPSGADLAPEFLYEKAAAQKGVERGREIARCK